MNFFSCLNILIKFLVIFIIIFSQTGCDSNIDNKPDKCESDEIRDCSCTDGEVEKAGNKVRRIYKNEKINKIICPHSPKL